MKSTVSAVFVISAVYASILTPGTVTPQRPLRENTTRSLYGFHEECQTFEKAKWICEEEGGHLLIINSDEEAAEVWRLFRRHPASRLRCEAELFLGAHFDDTSGQFLTLDGETLEEAGFAKWAPGEPNNLSVDSAGEQCVTFYRNRRLNDLGCEMRRPFVCEFPDYSYHRSSNSLYKLHIRDSSISDASRTCMAHGGHLASIDNFVEADIVKTYLPQGYSLTRIGFHYDFDNELSPSGTAAQCIALDAAGKVVGVDCDVQSPFLCEVERRSHPATTGDLQRRRLEDPKIVTLPPV